MQILETWQARLSPLMELGWQAAIAPGTALTGRSLQDRSPTIIERTMPLLRWISQDYFQAKTDGWENVPAGQVLMIGSHNGGLGAPDTLIMTYEWFRRFGPHRPIYALMEPHMWQAMPAVARLASYVGAIQAEPHMALKALDSGASLVIYPGGAKDVFRPYSQRHRICLNGRQGFIKLALEYHLPIVPMISHGAHETLIVLAEIYDELSAIAPNGFPWPFGLDPGVFPIYLGLPWGLAIGPLPNIPFPHPVQTRVCSPIWFDRYGEEAAHDHDYMDRCYAQVESEMQTALDRLVAECEG